ncbi:MAG: energy transducer TonB [Bacteroidales bacterium]|nr:energy transducer TonB [Bacteroidales bacterium]
MKRLFFLLSAVLLSAGLYAQNPTGTTLAQEQQEEIDDVLSPVEGTVYDTVSEQPSLKDGTDFAVWIAKNLKYPAQAKEDYIQGRVTVRFVVTDKGKVRQVKVLRGVEESLDKEAVRVVSASSGKWKPGTLDGKPVNTRLLIPVVFRIQ